MTLVKRYTTEDASATSGRAAGSGITGFWPSLVIVLLSGFVLRLVTAVALPNLERGDEVFQNLEPAFRMWSGGGVMTWEWHEGIRSPIFPGFLAGLISLSAQAGAGVAGYMSVVAAVMSLLSTAAIAVGFLVGWKQSGWGGAVICGTLCAFWPDLVYYGPKPMAEVQAGNILIVAAYVLAYANGPNEPGTMPRDRRLVAWQMFAGGILLGLVFCVRFHLAPAILVIALWVCRLQFRRRWLFLASGGLLPVIGMGIVDLFYWGSLFHSVWRNYEINVIEHVSENFGVSPVYFYFGKFVSMWGAAAVPILLAFLFGLRCAPLLGVVAAVIVLSHSAISHKEISFVYAALPPAFIVIGLGTIEIVRSLLSRIVLGPAVVMATTCLWMAIDVTTASSAGYRPQWSSHAAVLYAEQAAAKDPELCGLGIRGPRLQWFWTGGDTYLGRPVPIYAFKTMAGVARVAPAINYVIGSADVADGLPGFSKVRCWKDDDAELCLARADPGKICVPDPQLELNNDPNLGRHSPEF